MAESAIVVGGVILVKECQSEVHPHFPILGYASPENGYQRQACERVAAVGKSAIARATNECLPLFREQHAEEISSFAKNITNYDILL